MISVVYVLPHLETAMSDDERFRLVESMRQAQRRYSRTRDADVLEQSKRLEAEVDEMLAARKAGPGLFGAPKDGEVPR